MARALLETLLPRFFDLIHVATDSTGDNKVRCIVMNNLKPVAELTGVRIHQTYDLKGSWVNRFRGSTPLLTPSLFTPSVRTFCSHLLFTPFCSHL